jgi:protoheme IX farnesyltransferase
MRSLPDNPTPGATPGAAEGSLRGGFFARYAWGVLLFNLFVIVVGTVVRATRSGDGCGAHWPLCDGEFIPTAPSVARMIEYTHRLVSGIDGPLVIGLAVGAFALFKRGNPVRKASLVALFFTFTEAIIGAVLVKKGYVADNASAMRALWMTIHLTNTFFLLTSLAMTAWYAAGRRDARGGDGAEGGGVGSRLKLRGQGAVGAALALCFGAMLLLGASGAVTALGDTLFPGHSHEEVMRLAAQPNAHFLLKLRVLHPYIAGSVGLYTLLIAGLVAHLRPSPLTKRFAYGIVWWFVAQIAVGGLNVWLKAPVWMQIVHLLMADIVWLCLVLLSAAALAEGVPQVELAPVPENTAVLETGARPTWRDYLALTKPRVISLLLFTTLAAMVVAKGGWPGWGLFLAVALGGYMAAGAANAINMVIDRDIDHRMARTRTRPTVTERIPSRDALFFGFGLAVGSFALLFAAANLLTAMLALAGLVFYVLIYTLLLKRRTWHNIVIGGAAGAFPPLVGWAAVTGSLSPLAWYLFAIVFAWTPAHFWALALLIKDDYKDAGVPMLPVVLGDRVTVLQIALYSVLTAVVSLLPLAQGLVGWYYVGAALLLNLVLIARSVKLYVKVDRPNASWLFHYSMVYLALLFLALALDKASAQVSGTLVTAALVAGMWYWMRRTRKGTSEPAPPVAAAGA